MGMILEWGMSVLAPADEWLPGVFTGVEEIDTKTGPSLKWSVELRKSGEEWDGQSVNRLTSRTINVKSVAGNFFLALSGVTAENAEGVKVDFDKLAEDETPVEVFLVHKVSDRGTFANIDKLRLRKSAVKKTTKTKEKTESPPEPPVVEDDDDPNADMKIDSIDPDGGEEDIPF